MSFFAAGVSCLEVGLTALEFLLPFWLHSGCFIALQSNQPPHLKPTCFPFELLKIHIHMDCSQIYLHTPQEPHFTCPDGQLSTVKEHFKVCNTRINAHLPKNSPALVLDFIPVSFVHHSLSVFNPLLNIHESEI